MAIKPAKRRPLAAVLALSVFLTGCSSLLDREYVNITPHNAAPTAEGDPSTLRADSYQELVNALLYFITIGAESGSVRLYLDSSEVEHDLEAACLEVAREDPLGAYSVDFITYSVDPVVAYFDAQVQITYRRSREQVASIVSATGVPAIRSALQDAMDDFAAERVLRISHFSGGAAFIRELAREAYYLNPSAALDMPEITVNLYPDSGLQRIVEIGLSYHLELPELERRKEDLAQALQGLNWSLPSQPPAGNELILDAARAVLDAGEYDPEGGSTAYHALVEGGADSEGFSLAFSALCTLRGIDCRVVDGALDGEPHFWNVVSTADGWRHLDLSAFDEETPFGLDPELLEAGYAWDAGTVPQCGPSVAP